MNRLFITCSILLTSGSSFGMKALPIEDARKKVSEVSILDRMSPDPSAKVAAAIAKAHEEASKDMKKFADQIVIPAPTNLGPLRPELPKPLDISRYFPARVEESLPPKKLEYCSEEVIQKEIFKHERKELLLENKLKEREQQNIEMQTKLSSLESERDSYKSETEKQKQDISRVEHQKVALLDEVSNLKKMLEEMMRLKTIAESESAQEKQKRIAAEQERDSHKAKSIDFENKMKEAQQKAQVSEQQKIASESEKQRQTQIAVDAEHKRAAAEAEKVRIIEEQRRITAEKDNELFLAKKQIEQEKRKDVKIFDILAGGMASNTGCRPETAVSNGTVSKTCYKSEEINADVVLGHGSRFASDTLGSCGHVVYGPYTKLDCGHYRADFSYSAKRMNGGSYADIYIMSPSAKTWTQLTAKSFVNADSGILSLDFDVDISKSKNLFETRAFFSGVGELLVKSILLTKINH